MKLRKSIAVILSLVMLLSAVAVGGVLPAAAAVTAEPQTITSGNLFPAADNYVDGATVTLSAGEDQGTGFLTDGILYGVSAGSGQSNQHYTVTDLTAGQALTLTVDFGAVKAVGALEVGGITAKFTNLFLPAYTLYLTNDASTKSNWQQIVSVDANTAKAQYGYVFELSETVNAQYLIMETTAYAGQTSYWLGELGAAKAVPGSTPTPGGTETTDLYDSLGNPMYALTAQNLPTEQNLLKGHAPTVGTTSTAAEVRGGTVEELTDNKWQGIDSITDFIYITTPKEVKGKKTEDVPGQPGKYFDYESWGWTKTNGAVCRVALTGAAQGDGLDTGLTFDMGTTVNVSGFSLGSTVEIGTWQIGNAPTEVQDLEARRNTISDNVLLYKAEIYVGNDKATLYDTANLVSKYDLSAAKLKSLRNKIVLNTEKEGRYVGFRFPVVESQIRISEIAAYGAVEIESDITELTSEAAVPANNLLCDLLATDEKFAPITDADFVATAGYETDGKAFPAANGAVISAHGAGDYAWFVYELPALTKIEKFLVAGMGTKPIKDYQIYASDNSANLTANSSQVAKYTNEDANFCELIKLKTPVNARFVALKVHKAADNKAYVAEFGAYNTPAALTTVPLNGASELPKEFNLLTGLTPKMLNNGAMSSYWEGNDGILDRVNAPSSHTNQFGTGACPSTNPGKIVYDLGAAYTIGTLLFGNNGSDGGSHMCQSYKIYVADTEATLFGGTPVAQNSGVNDSSKPAWIHRLAKPATGRFVGFEIVGAKEDNIGRIGELGAYAVNDNTAAAVQKSVSFSDVLADSKGTSTGTKAVYELKGTTMLDTLTVTAKTGAEVYVGNVKNCLFSAQNLIKKVGAGTTTIEYRKPVSANFVGVIYNETDPGNGIAAGCCALQMKQITDAKDIPADGLLGGLTPGEIEPSTAAIKTATVKDGAYATDGLIKGLNSQNDQYLTAAGSKDIIYKLDKFSSIKQILVSADTAKYSVFLSDTVDKLFVSGSKVMDYDSVNPGNDTQLFTPATPIDACYVGLRVEAGKGNQTRVYELNVYGTSANKVDHMLTFANADLLPKETNLIAGKTPCNTDTKFSNAARSTDGVVYGIHAQKWRTANDTMTVFTTVNNGAITYDLGSARLVNKFLVDSCSLPSTIKDFVANYSIFVGNDPADLYNTTNRVFTYHAREITMAQTITLDKPAMGRYVGFLIEVNDGTFTAFDTHWLAVGELGVYSANPGTDTMINKGAQIRDDGALRFAASVLASGSHAAKLAGDTVGGKTVKEAGMIIAMQDKVKGELKLDSGKAPAGAVLVPAQNLYETTNGCVLFTAVVNHIPASYNDWMVVARPYVLFTDNSVLYTDAMVRSVNSTREMVNNAGGPVVYEVGEAPVDFGDGSLSIGSFGPFKQITFTHKYSDGVERSAYVAVPDVALPGNHWLFVAEFYGNQYAAVDTTRSLVAKGWYVVTLNGIGDTYGSDWAVGMMDEFHDVLVEKFHMNNKCVPMGVSRGGLYSVNYAIAHPDHVAGLYLDASVQDICSWPGGRALNNRLDSLYNYGNKVPAGATAPYRQYKGNGSRGIEWSQAHPVNPTDSVVHNRTEWVGAYTDYGYKNEDDVLLHDTKSPVYNYDKLIATDIPIFLQVSEADTLVPYDENGLKLYKYFTEHGEKTLRISDTEAKINAMTFGQTTGLRLLMIGATDIINRDGRGGHTHGWHTPDDSADYIILNMSK